MTISLLGRRRTRCMANNPKSEAEQSSDQLAFELRQAVSNAYAFVKGRESVQSFASFTFEDAMDRQIEAIEGKDSPSRPNQLHRVDKIENDIVTAAQKIKSLPPELFNEPDASKDVNTPEEGSD